MGCGSSTQQTDSETPKANGTHAPEGSGSGTRPVRGPSPTLDFAATTAKSDPGGAAADASNTSVASEELILAGKQPASAAAAAAAAEAKTLLAEADTLTTAGRHSDALDVYQRALMAAQAAQPQLPGTGRAGSASASIDNPSVRGVAGNTRGVRVGSATAIDERPLLTPNKSDISYHLGVSGVTTVPYLMKLAACLRQLKAYDRAVPLLHRCIDLRTRSLGASHPDTVDALLQMAGLLDAMGCHDNAVPLYRRAWETVRDEQGPGHADTLARAADLGACLVKAGEAEDALPLLRSTLDARSEVLGPEHPQTLQSLRTLATCLQRLGLLTDAAPLLRRLVASLQASPDAGPDHADTLAAEERLAHCLQNMGATREAMPIFRKSLKKRRESLGMEHPSTVRSVKNLASLLSQDDDAEGALPLYREALQAARAGRHAARGSTTGGTGSTNGGSTDAVDAHEVLDAAHALATCLGRLGRWTEAEQYFREAVEASRAVHDGGTQDADPEALRLSAGLAECVEAQGGAEGEERVTRWREALGMWEAAAGGLAAVVGALHRDTLRAQARLAALRVRVAQAEGNEEGAAAAREQFGRCVETCRAVMGREHPDALALAAALDNPVAAGAATAPVAAAAAPEGIEELCLGGALEAISGEGHDIAGATAAEQAAHAGTAADLDTEAGAGGRRGGGVGADGASGQGEVEAMHEDDEERARDRDSTAALDAAVAALTAEDGGAKYMSPRLAQSRKSCSPPGAAA